MNRFKALRRWGVAALAGITCLGAVALVGEGVASAATSVSNVSFTSTSYAAAASSGVNWTVAFTPTTALAAAGTITVTFPAGFTLPATGATLTLNSNFSDCSATEVTAGSAATLTLANSGGTCAVAVSTVTSVTIDGFTNPLAAGTIAATSFTVATSTDTGIEPASASVTITPTATISSTPVAVATGSLNNALGTVTVTIPDTYQAEDSASTAAQQAASDVVPVCLAIDSSADAVENFNVSGGEPTVTQSDGAASGVTVLDPEIFEAASLPSGFPAADTGHTAGATSSSNFTGFIEADELGFFVTGTTSTEPLTFTITGLHVDGDNAGVVNVGVEVGAAAVAPANLVAGYTAVCSNTQIATEEIYSVGTTPSAIAGTSATQTAAAEFQDAEVYVSSTNVPECLDNGNAILSTAFDPSDALSAAYLEGELGTGVMITPISSTGAIDPATLAALKYAGVARVYVVGGVDAFTAAEIATLQATPAWTCGGLAETGSDLVVYSGISGENADNTAAAIDNYITAGEGGKSLLPSLSSAYAAASSYNQTTGNATATAPTAVNGTAIVVETTDWQDSVTAAGIAYKYHIPVVLNTGATLSAVASTELTTLGFNQVIALGGELALPNAVVTGIQALDVSVNGTLTPISVVRIAGADYTQTAADLASFEGTVLSWPQSTVFLAQGAYWSDALAAAPLSAHGPAAAALLTGSAILLTESPTTTIGTYTTAALTTAGTAPNGLGDGLTTTIQVLGGPDAVPASQITAAQAALDAG